MLPLLSPSILYHHILTLLRLWKNSASSLQILWHPRYDKNIFICGPLLTWTTQVYDLFGVVRGVQIYKIGLAMGVIMPHSEQKSATGLIPWLWVQYQGEPRGDCKHKCTTGKPVVPTKIVVFWQQAKYFSGMTTLQQLSNAPEVGHNIGHHLPQ